MTAQTAQRLSVRISERRQLADQILGLTLSPTTDTPLPEPSPGAHIDLHLPNGLTRQYSIVRYSELGYELGILRDSNSRGGSSWIHDQLQPGDTLEISSPRNLFALQPDCRRALLFAGGIGITPILAMADTLHASDADFSLHYCARSPLTAAYVQHLQTSAWQTAAHLYFDDGDRVFDAAALLEDVDPQTQIYVCGPAGFIDHILNTAAACGWLPEQLHFERFQPIENHNTDDGSFELLLNRSGQRLLVGPAQTAIDALHAAGFEVPVSCEQGICGTCLIPVLDGEPEHRDLFLTDAERAANNCFTPCCSRGKGQLTVDL